MTAACRYRRPGIVPLNAFTAARILAVGRLATTDLPLGQWKPVLLAAVSSLALGSRCAQQHERQWAAIEAVADKIGCTP